MFCCYFFCGTFHHALIVLSIKHCSAVFVSNKYHYLELWINGDSQQFNPNNRFVVLFCLPTCDDFFFLVLIFLCFTVIDFGILLTGLCSKHLYPYYSVFTNYSNFSLCLYRGRFMNL